MFIDYTLADVTSGVISCDAHMTVDPKTSHQQRVGLMVYPRIHLHDQSLVNCYFVVDMLVYYCLEVDIINYKET